MSPPWAGTASFQQWPTGHQMMSIILACFSCCKHVLFRFWWCLILFWDINGFFLTVKSGLHLLGVISLYLYIYLSLISTLNFSVYKAAARLAVAPWWTCIQQHTELIWSKSRCDHMRVSAAGPVEEVGSGVLVSVKLEPSKKPEVKPQKRS